MIKHKNLGTVNRNMVSIGLVDLYFSYETIVGVRSPDGTFCCQNEWGPTTGKFLNDIEPDKSKRLPYNKFLEMVNSALEAEHENS